MKGRRRRYPEIELDIIMLLEKYRAMDSLSLRVSLPYYQDYPLGADFESLESLERKGAIVRNGKRFSLAPPPPPHTPISQNDRPELEIED